VNRSAGRWSLQSRPRYPTILVAKPLGDVVANRQDSVSDLDASLFCEIFGGLLPEYGLSRDNLRSARALIRSKTAESRKLIERKPVSSVWDCLERYDAVNQTEYAACYTTRYGGIALDMTLMFARAEGGYPSNRKRMQAAIRIEEATFPYSGRAAIDLAHDIDLLCRDCQSVIPQSVGSGNLKLLFLVEFAERAALICASADGISVEDQKLFHAIFIHLLPSRSKLDDYERYDEKGKGESCLTLRARLVASNPGLQSRFNKYLSFADYSPAELGEIIRHFCDQNDYRLTESATEKLQTLFQSAYETRDKTFGNARFARNIFERAIENQSTRILTLDMMGKDVLTTLEACDISLPSDARGMEGAS